MAASGLTLGVTAAADAEVVSQEAGLTSIDSYADHVAWSSFDPATGKNSLRALVRGEVRTLPVRPQSQTFDVDLGPGPTGGVVAVYSRCASPTPGAPNGGVGPPPQARSSGGPGCRIFLYDFASNAERMLPRGKSNTSEFVPTIWKDRLAVFSTRSSGFGPVSLLTRPIDARTRGRELRAGRRVFGPDEDQPQPVDADLRGRRIAFTWQDVPGTQSPCRTEDSKVDAERTEVWTTTVGGDRRRLDRVCQPQPGSPRLASAAVLPDGVAYLRRAGVSSQYVTVKASGERTFVPAPSSIDVTVLGSSFYFVRELGGRDYEIGREPIEAP